MNNNEAKFILTAYRPNGADAGDATFCAAVQQAQLDPALGAWFEAEQRFDRTLSSKLRQCQPPESLHAAILAGARVSSAEAARPWWQLRGPMLAAAAGIAALLTVSALILWPARLDAREVSRFAVQDTLVNETNHHGHGNANAALQAALQDPQRHLAAGVPVDYEALANTGCRSLHLAGKQVLEVCFERNGVWFHCYIVKGEGLRFPSDGPEFSTDGKLASVTWRQADLLMVVVGSSGVAALKGML